MSRAVCFIDESGQVATCINDEVDDCSFCECNPFPSGQITKDRVLPQGYQFKTKHL